MSDIIQFGLLGLGLGAMFALAAQGVVLIYRGSGVLNFAHGAVGMVGAYVFWELRTNHGWSSVAATLSGVAVAGGLGAATHLLVMRPLRRASALVRLVATLGLLILLQSAAVLRYGSNFYVVPSILPTTRYEPFSGVSITLDRLLLAVIAVVITVVLYAVYRFTRFGLGTT